MLVKKIDSKLVKDVLMQVSKNLDKILQRWSTANATSKIDDLLEAKKSGRDTKELETEIREAYKEVQEY